MGKGDQRAIKFSRSWIYYQVVPVFEEKPPEHVWPELSDEQKRQHADAHLPGWETQICVLPRRTICSISLKEILNLKRHGLACRIYPPFPLNERGQMSGELQGVRIPAGTTQVDHDIAIPDSAVTGVTAAPNLTEGFHLCQGLRFDFQSGFPVVETLREFVDHITIHTHQWWLRLGYDPFSGPFRLAMDLEKNFEPRSELRYRGAHNVQGCWRGMNSTQSLIGFEQALDNRIWKNCGAMMREETKPESGFLAFSDALAFYMAGEDDRCILNLALSFEILGNKRSFADNGKFISKKDQLHKVSKLIDSENCHIIHDLLIDRDHVAHGRPPYILGRKAGATLERYLEGGMSVINNYIRGLGPGEWHELSKLELVSSRIRSKQ